MFGQHLNKVVAFQQTLDSNNLLQASWQEILDKGEAASANYISDEIEELRVIFSNAITTPQRLLQFVELANQLINPPVVTNWETFLQTHQQALDDLIQQPEDLALFLLLVKPQFFEPVKTYKNWINEPEARAILLIYFPARSLFNQEEFAEFSAIEIATVTEALIVIPATRVELQMELYQQWVSKLQNVSQLAICLREMSLIFSQAHELDEAQTQALTQTIIVLFKHHKPNSQQLKHCLALLEFYGLPDEAGFIVYSLLLFFPEYFDNAEKIIFALQETYGENEQIIPLLAQIEDLVDRARAVEYIVMHGSQNLLGITNVHARRREKDRATNDLLDTYITPTLAQCDSITPAEVNAIAAISEDAHETIPVNLVVKCIDDCSIDDLATLADLADYCQREKCSAYQAYIKKHLAIINDQSHPGPTRLLALKQFSYVTYPNNPNTPDIDCLDFLNDFEHYLDFIVNTDERWANHINLNLKNCPIKSRENLAQLIVAEQEHVRLVRYYRLSNHPPSFFNELYEIFICQPTFYANYKNMTPQKFASFLAEYYPTKKLPSLLQCIAQNTDKAFSEQAYLSFSKNIRGRIHNLGDVLLLHSALPFDKWFELFQDAHHLGHNTNFYSFFYHYQANLSTEEFAQIYEWVMENKFCIVCKLSRKQIEELESYEQDATQTTLPIAAPETETEEEKQENDLDNLATQMQTTNQNDWNQLLFQPYLANHQARQWPITEIIPAGLLATIALYFSAFLSFAVITLLFFAKYRQRQTVTAEFLLELLAHCNKGAPLAPKICEDYKATLSQMSTSQFITLAMNLGLRSDSENFPEDHWILQRIQTIEVADFDSDEQLAKWISSGARHGESDNWLTVERSASLQQRFSNIDALIELIRHNDCASLFDSNDRILPNHINLTSENGSYAKKLTELLNLIPISIRPEIVARCRQDNITLAASITDEAEFFALTQVAPPELCIKMVKNSYRLDSHNLVQQLGEQLQSIHRPSELQSNVLGQLWGVALTANNDDALTAYQLIVPYLNDRQRVHYLVEHFYQLLNVFDTPAEKFSHFMELLKTVSHVYWPILIDGVNHTDTRLEQTLLSEVFEIPENFIVLRNEFYKEYDDHRFCQSLMYCLAIIFAQHNCFSPTDLAVMEMQKQGGNFKIANDISPGPLQIWCIRQNVSQSTPNFLDLVIRSTRPVLTIHHLVEKLNIQAKSPKNQGQTSRYYNYWKNSKEWPGFKKTYSNASTMNDKITQLFVLRTGDANRDKAIERVSNQLIEKLQAKSDNYFNMINVLKKWLRVYHKTNITSPPMRHLVRKVLWLQHQLEQEYLNSLIYPDDTPGADEEAKTKQRIREQQYNEQTRAGGTAPATEGEEKMTAAEYDREKQRERDAGQQLQQRLQPPAQSAAAPTSSEGAIESKRHNLDGTLALPAAPAVAVVIATAVTDETVTSAPHAALLPAPPNHQPLRTEAEEEETEVAVPT